MLKVFFTSKRWDFTGDKLHYKRDDCHLYFSWKWWQTTKYLPFPSTLWFVSVFSTQAGCWRRPFKPFLQEEWQLMKPLSQKFVTWSFQLTYNVQLSILPIPWMLEFVLFKVASMRHKALGSPKLCACCLQLQQQQKSLLCQYQIYPKLVPEILRLLQELFARKTQM